MHIFHAVVALATAGGVNALLDFAADVIKALYETRINGQIHAYPRYQVVFDPDITQSESLAYGTDSDGLSRQFMMLQGDQYLCLMPQPQNETEAVRQGAGAEKSLETVRKEAMSSMASVGNSCIYHTAGWWTYEFCYNRYVKQFHRREEQNLQRLPPVPLEDERFESYVLGKAPNGVAVEDTELAPVSASSDYSAAGSSSLSYYYAQHYKEGTTCDPTGKSRVITVEFYCDPTVQSDRIVTVREVSTCKYVMSVMTNRLCGIDVFARAANTDDTVTNITCRRVVADDGSSNQPLPHDPSALLNSRVPELGLHLDLEQEHAWRQQQKKDADIEIPAAGVIGDPVAVGEKFLEEIAMILELEGVVLTNGNGEEVQVDLDADATFVADFEDDDHSKVASAEFELNQRRLRLYNLQSIDGVMFPEVVLQRDIGEGQRERDSQHELQHVSGTGQDDVPIEDTNAPETAASEAPIVTLTDPVESALSADISTQPTSSITSTAHEQTDKTQMDNSARSNDVHDEL